jgi:3-isopropylmalate dehydrogenase
VSRTTATTLSAAMRLRHSLGLEREASLVEAAVERALEQGVLDRGSASTDAAGAAVVANIEVLVG